MQKKQANAKQIVNRRARHDYDLGDGLLVGIVLTGAETKALRMGHGHYLTAQAGRNVVLSRVGPVDLQTLAYGETLAHRGVTISFHPAGHVLGSAQIRLEHQGRVWVVSGDYKRRP